jgi:hypothetical protein
LEIIMADVKDTQAKVEALSGQLTEMQTRINEDVQALKDKLAAADIDAAVLNEVNAGLDSISQRVQAISRVMTWRSGLERRRSLAACSPSVSSTSLNPDQWAEYLGALIVAASRQARSTARSGWQPPNERSGLVATRHRLSKHFVVEEFDCHDGTKVSARDYNGLEYLCRQFLEPLRKKYGP